LKTFFINYFYVLRYVVYTMSTYISSYLNISYYYIIRVGNYYSNGYICVYLTNCIWFHDTKDYSIILLYNIYVCRIIIVWIIYYDQF